MISLIINNNEISTDLDENTPLLWFIRDELGLTGTKFGCGKGLCGACTVHLNGRAVRSCTLPISAVGNAKITTIEGDNSVQIAALKSAWIKHNVPQCGYCQVGQLMSAASLLVETISPDEAQINQAMSGNICRCGTYARIKQGLFFIETTWHQ
jgi:isoquinoline 1-oxidoreductase alpha subunit